MLLSTEPNPDRAREERGAFCVMFSSFPLKPCTNLTHQSGTISYRARVHLFHLVQSHFKKSVIISPPQTVPMALRDLRSFSPFFNRLSSSVSDFCVVKCYTLPLCIFPISTAAAAVLLRDEFAIACVKNHRCAEAKLAIIIDNKYGRRPVESLVDAITFSHRSFSLWR